MRPSKRVRRRGRYGVSMAPPGRTREAHLGALRGLLLGRLGLRGGRGGGRAALLHAHLHAVVLLVELLERRRIDLDDRILHQRLRAHLRAAPAGPLAPVAARDRNLTPTRPETGWGPAGLPRALRRPCSAGQAHAADARLPPRSPASCFLGQRDGQPVVSSGAPLLTLLVLGCLSSLTTAARMQLQQHPPSFAWREHGRPAHQLVVGRVVHHVQHARLARDRLRAAPPVSASAAGSARVALAPACAGRAQRQEQQSGGWTRQRAAASRRVLASGGSWRAGERGARLGAPREVARVQAQRAELVVAAAAAHLPDRHVGRQLGVGRLPAQLEPGGRAARRSALLLFIEQMWVHQHAAGRASTGAAPGGGCARGKAGAHFLFLRHFFCLPPVRRRLCSESREMPARGTRAPVKPGTQQRAPAPACSARTRAGTARQGLGNASRRRDCTRQHSEQRRAR